MKISLNWLRRYVDFEWDAETLGQRLTMAGLEVDEVIGLRPQFDGVRVGRVLQVKPHPQADKLCVAAVDSGEGSLDVVCGARNCRAGLIVAHAVPGARIADGMVIERREIRGVESLGMLCSERELGLSEAAAGILELDDGPTPGGLLADVLPIDDSVLDVALTANRGDCLSHLGVAREVAALSGGAVRYPKVVVEGALEGDPYPIEIHDAERCARYVGRTIRGLAVAESPFWMRRLLEAVGVRAINNIVDVTNFVLLEMGQPLHAFDLGRLRGGSIIVRAAHEGERMATLDGEARVLTVNDLLICDGDMPVAVAGVMGGLDTEVKPDTRDVFLESAWFKPQSVRLTSRRLGLRTESSHRFERSVDPGGTLNAANRACQLMMELSGPGSIPGLVKAFSDVNARQIERPVVTFNPRQTRRLIGVDVPPERQTQILTALGFDVEPVEGSDCWKVTTPSWRADVEEGADLIEEVTRFIGYDAIPAAAPRGLGVNDVAGDRPSAQRQRQLRAVRGFLANRGFCQALNYSFMGRSLHDHIDGGPALSLINPLTEDQAVLRTTLVARLLSNAAHNGRHGLRDVALYELGRVFVPVDVKGRQPDEVERLGVVLTGRREQHWSGTGRPVDFFELKGVVEDLCAALGLDVAIVGATDAPSWLHPGAAAVLRVGATPIGLLGEVHPQLVRALELPTPAFAAELDVEPLIGEAPSVTRFQDFARLPSISRDLSLVLSRSVTSAEVLSSIRELPLDVVDSVEVFDVYEGSEIGSNRRSLGITMTCRSTDRTLTDEEVSQAQGVVLRCLEARFGAVLR